MADIFLSYAEEDRETASGLARSLESAGWSVWWDRRIPPGRTWRDTIEQALDEMRCMVVLWSSHSIDSDWVCEEAEVGRTRDVLVPVLIERVEPPLGFRSIQAADLAGWDGDPKAARLLALLAHLESVLGRPRRRRRGVSDAPAVPVSPSLIRAPAQRRTMAMLAGAAVAPVVVLLAVAVLWQPQVLRQRVDATVASPEPAATGASGAPGTAVVPQPPAREPEREARHEDQREAVREPERAPQREAVRELDRAPAAPVRQTVQVESASAARAPAGAAGEAAHRAADEAARQPPQASRDRNPERCGAIRERASVGDPLTAEERAFLARECR